MKRVATIAAVLIALACAAPASAYDWAIQATFSGRTASIHDDAYDDVYDGASLSGFDLGIDSELLWGFGPYMRLFNADVEETYREEIEAQLSLSEAAIGLQWRYFFAPWVAPDLRVGFLGYGAQQTFDDGSRKVERDTSGKGFELAHSWNFYPLAFVESPYVRGIGLNVGISYTGRKHGDEFGRMDQLPSTNFSLGLTYRFTLPTRS